MKTNIFKHISLLLSASAFLGMASCADSVVESIDQEESGNVQLVKNINADVEAFEIGDEQTRSLYKEIENGYQFVWQEHDMIGVWGIEKLDGTPCEGPINFMRVQEGAGSSTVKFDGGDWSLRTDTKYYAFYPFDYNLLENNVVLDRDANLVTYEDEETGIRQEIDAHYPLAHLGNFDYITTEPQEADKDGNINFRFKHVGNLTRFQFKLPIGTMVTRVNMHTESISRFHSQIGVNKFGSISSSTSSEDFNLYVNGDLAVDNAGDITLYAMMSADDQSTSDVTITVYTRRGGSSHQYSFTTQGRKNKPGMIYTYQYDFSDYANLAAPEVFNEKVNRYLKEVKGNDYTNVMDVTTVRFLSVETLPSGINRSYDFSDDKLSGYSIYAKYNPSDELLEFYTLGQEIRPQSCESLFSGWQYLQNVDLSIFNTSKVNNMNYMFYGLPRLNNLDLSNFDISNVEQMKFMFYYCKFDIVLDISSFKPHNYLNISNMFMETSGKVKMSTDFYDYITSEERVNENNDSWLEEDKLIVTKIDE